MLQCSVLSANNVPAGRSACGLAAAAAVVGGRRLSREEGLDVAAALVVCAVLARDRQ